ncbi:hypothetical protein EES45_36095 [Streptomyces sp. ADI97-07]|uniref:hypothetical protein n=1 Tax=Streptomyces sp. ADI97-07 TaxID=1522762 RepID=UPI000F55482E|nr:hypothetical protein [Streptomyces sp. ADI97-07]RPK70062.1 hypothetical protein EES45_36095 [Streptomyces sp. ADI97-07]
MGRTRSTWSSKGVWFAGAALAAVLALTGYAVLSGDGDGGAAPGKAGSTSSADPSPSESYAAPEDWTEPERWVALPRGKRTDERGSEVGFPHTAEGAVAMAAAANTTVVEGETTNVDEQLRLYYGYIGQAEQSPEAAERVELAAIDSDKAIARSMGVTPGQPLPTGAYVRGNVVGYKVIKESADEVSVYLLSRVVQKGGETAPEKASYSRTLIGAQWQGQDWKLSVPATRRAQEAAQDEPEPEMAAPGDVEFNGAGWTAIREAS